MQPHTYNGFILLFFHLFCFGPLVRFQVRDNVLGIHVDVQYVLVINGIDPLSHGYRKNTVHYRKVEVRKDGESKVLVRIATRYASIQFLTIHSIERTTARAAACSVGAEACAPDSVITTLIYLIPIPPA